MRGHRLALGLAHPPGLCMNQVDTTGEEHCLDLGGAGQPQGGLAPNASEEQGQRPVDPEVQDDEEGEELEELPQTVKERDPLRHAKITWDSGGEVCFGYVEDIEVGKTTGERVYLIRYLDGDVQHMTEQQVRSMRIDENLDPDGVDSEEDSDDDGDAAYNEALAEEDEDRKKLGALYLEVRRAALETIARVDAKGKITAEDIFNNVLDMSTWTEHRATEKYEMMVVRHAIGQAIQEAVSTGIIVKCGMTRESGPVYTRKMK